MTRATSGVSEGRSRSSDKAHWLWWQEREDVDRTRWGEGHPRGTPQHVPRQEVGLVP